MGMLERKKRCIGGCPLVEIRFCNKGEETYFSRYPDVFEAVEKGMITSASSHWVNHGKVEGREYECRGQNSCMTKYIENGLISQEEEEQKEKEEEDGILTSSE